MTTDSGGYWNSLEEMAKATQSLLCPGVVEEDIKRNSLLDKAPVAQATGTGPSIKWLREGTLDESTVADFDIGEELLWTKGGNYTVVESALKRCYKAVKLDNFVVDIHKTVNDYEALMMKECEKLVLRKLGHKFIYDDITYGSAKQFDGLHALAALNCAAAVSDGVLDIDNAEAGLALGSMRDLIDNGKHGWDGIYMPYIIYRYLNQAFEERGLVSLASGTAGSLMNITRTLDDLGKSMILRYGGVPIIPTDYLLAEQANTGRGTTLRALHTTGTANYSVFFVKWGNPMAGSNPGLALGFGSTKGVGEFFKLDVFDKLPNYDARGIRLINYSAPLLGSKLCLGRIHDVIATAVTA